MEGSLKSRKLWHAVKNEFVGLTTTDNTETCDSATKPNHVKKEESSSTPAPVKGGSTSLFGIPDVSKTSSTPVTVATEEDSSNSNSNNDDEAVPSQVSWSQSDEHIYRLDREGELNEVVGAGSMLSQELTMVRGSNEEDSEAEDEAEPQPETQESAFGSVGLGCSQATETSIAMAQRLGILTQPEEDDDGDDGGNTENEDKTKKLPESQPEKVSSQPFSLVSKPRVTSPSKTNIPEGPPPTDKLNGKNGKSKILKRSDGAESKKPQPKSSPQTFSITNQGKQETKDSAANDISVATKVNNVAPGNTTPLSRPSKRKEPFKSPEMRDTPIRQSECFGSLLEAVQVIASQDEEDYALQLQFQSQEEVPDVNSSMAKQGSTGKNLPAKRKASSLSTNRAVPRPGGHAAAVAAAAAITNIRNGTANPKPVVATTTTKIHDNTTSANTAKRPRKTHSSAEKQAEKHRVQHMAQRAANLAEQTVSNPDMAKKLLLSMALVRENPRTAPATWPPRGSVVPEGFFWAHYPPLEAVLKQHMSEYYELSTTKCQSAQQQAFNNDLVILIRDAVAAQGWELDSCFKCDKVLRDRIRCYYKTHIQNAKKRLRTMVRNPTKRANARHLCAHLDLIEQSSKTDDPSKFEDPE